MVQRRGATGRLLQRLESTASVRNQASSPNVLWISQYLVQAREPPEISPSLHSSLFEANETIATSLTGTESESALVIGGVAMILHGLGRKTEDVDLATPAAVVYRIQEFVGSDNRFSGGTDTDSLEFESSNGINVGIDLIPEMDDGDPETMPLMVAGAPDISEIHPPSLEDLLTSKVAACSARRETNDCRDIDWLVGHMKAVGIGLIHATDNAALAGAFDRLKWLPDDKGGKILALLEELE